MFTIVLQAGGESSRMGKDKALLPFLGIPIIQRLRDRFQEIGEELVIVSNDFAGYKYLKLPLYKDVIPGRGALGGLYTALTVSSSPLVGLIAADLPFANPALFEYMLEQILITKADAIIPSTKYGLEPMHAIYSKDTCLPLVKKALDDNLWRMKAWHDSANIQILDPGQTLEITGSDYTFLNLNTPAEFKTAEEIARNENLE